MSREFVTGGNPSRSFYYYGYGSWDSTKKFLLMKPLKGVEKNE